MYRKGESSLHTLTLTEKGYQFGDTSLYYTPRLVEELLREGKWVKTGWVQLTKEEVEANRRTAYDYIF